LCVMADLLLVCLLVVKVDIHKSKNKLKLSSPHATFFSVFLLCDRILWQFRLEKLETTECGSFGLLC